MRFQIGSSRNINVQIFRRDTIFLQHSREEFCHINGQNISLGHVDRNRHWTDTLVDPHPDGLAHFLPDILVQLRDIAVAFQYRDEHCGRNDAQYRVVPAHQRLGTDDLAGVQLIPRLQEEGELVLAQAVQDLRHQYALVETCTLHRLAAQNAVARIPGQALQQFQDLPHFAAAAVARLLVGGGNDRLVELFQKQPGLTIHDSAQDIVCDVEEDRQDHACNRGIECRVDAGQNGLHAAQRGFHRDEADAPQAQQQTHEGAKDAQTGQGAGQLCDDAFPCVQRQHVLVEHFVKIADDLPGLTLMLYFFTIFLKQSVQRLLLEKAFDLQGSDPCGAAFGLRRLADAFLAVQQTARNGDGR